MAANFTDPEREYPKWMNECTNAIEKAAVMFAQNTAVYGYDDVIYEWTPEQLASILYATLKQPMLMACMDSEACDRLSHIMAGVTCFLPEWFCRHAVCLWMPQNDDFRALVFRPVMTRRGLGVLCYILLPSGELNTTSVLLQGEVAPPFFSLAVLALQTHLGIP